MKRKGVVRLLKPICKICKIRRSSKDGLCVDCLEELELYRLRSALTEDTHKYGPYTYFLRYKCKVVLNKSMFEYRDAYGIHTDEPCGVLFGELPFARRKELRAYLIEHIIGRIANYHISTVVSRKLCAFETKMHFNISVRDLKIDKILTYETYNQKFEEY